MKVCTDVTEKTRLEAQFLRTQRLESIGMLAGGIAHDLNNILAPVIMSIVTLKYKLSGRIPFGRDSQVEKILETIESSANAEPRWSGKC